MKQEEIKRQNNTFRYIEADAVVVGTGAAGYNAAAWLRRLGVLDVAIITEGRLCGTSRNTGSDKQTYYKLSLAGEIPDSVRSLAQVFFDGQCVDEDMALCEAALSAYCFYRLAGLGVPFPQNQYGEYIGYKTDHDPGKRATSAGPYTSKMMTEALEKEVGEQKTSILDHLQVIRVLTRGETCYGLLCLDTGISRETSYVVVSSGTVIYATGGPAGMYRDSVYPLSQYGASGLAFEAGVRGKNLTEWQYGLASLHPRWNVSGTYMQALPKFISTDAEGGDEREFLLDLFESRAAMLDNIFLKGYQWPFDTDKIQNGSSIIDLLVYRECFEKGRRVFLDYRTNPGGEALDFTVLHKETRTYLEKAGACFGTPLERLWHMNAPAVEFYREHQVDLATQPLEVAICAQHNNGGLSTDFWWQTNIRGLFAVGEVCGSHGVRRPGGSALNAGQAGALRAALYGAKYGKPVTTWDEDTAGDLWALIEERIALGEATVTDGEKETLCQLWMEATARMSRKGGMIRNEEGIEQALKETKALLEHFDSRVRITSSRNLPEVYRFYDMLVSQYVYLSAMQDYRNHGGQSRGSALYTDQNGISPSPYLSEIFRFRLDEGRHGGEIQETQLQNGECICSWRPVRRVPVETDFFETVWKSYRETGNIDR